MKNLLKFLMVTFLVISMVGCTKEPVTPEQPDNPSNPTVNPTKEGTIGKLEEAIRTALGDNYLIDTEIEKDSLFLCGLYEIDIEKVNDLYAANNSIASVNPDTLVIVDCKEGYGSEVVQMLQSYYTQNVEYQQLYPFAVEKVKNTRIYQYGDFVILATLGNYPDEDEKKEAEQSIADYTLVDEAIKSVMGELPENLAKIVNE